MFLTYLTLISGISLSIIAAGYSIIGLAALFAGATTAIYAMGGALEVAKLVMASWLYNNWNSPLLPKSIKYYLTSAVVVLIFITSVGIFGFLSKAHLDQVVPESNNALQIEIIDEQIEQRQKTIDRSQKQLTRMDDLIETQSEETSWFTSSSQKAITERNNQKLERLSLEETIDQSLNKINELSDKKSGIRTEQLKIEADLGPIKYVAEFLYGDEAVNHFDKAVRIIIIILIFVFDPVAVLMLISANISLRERRMLIGETFKELEDNNKDIKNLVQGRKDELVKELVEIITANKKDWKKDRDYKEFMESLTDEERAILSPDEIKLKLNQIHTWSEGDDKYKNNV
jgi:Spy/CpxP family protein refolding chaperone